MKTTRQNFNESRRRFVVSSAAAAGGLALGMNIPFGAGSAKAQAPLAASPEVNAW
jgi:isoquinoline 1-oxidoreductase beta subunit